MAIRDSLYKDEKQGQLKAIKVYQFDHTTESGKAPLFVKPGEHFGQRYLWHLKRWWWLYALIVFVIIVLLVVLLVVFLAYPHLAQGRLNETSLVLDEVELLDTTEAGYQVRIQGRLNTNNSYSPTLDPFNVSLSVGNDGTNPPFLTVPVPELKVTPSTPFAIEKNVTITDKASFMQFLQSIISAPALVPIVVQGSTTLHDGGLPAQTVSFKKSAGFSGLDNLKGMTMQNVTLLAQPDSRHNNFFADLHIFNPSQITLDFGNATFDNYFNSSIFGWSYVDNMVIRPGNNVLPLRAITDLMGIEQGVQQQPYCSSGIVPLTLKPRFVFNQISEINYYQDVLQPLTLDFTADVGSSVGKVLNKTISCPSKREAFTQKYFGL